jgi:hypothetical protein
MLLLTTETRRAQRELFFLPERETAIGQEIAALPGGFMSMVGSKLKRFRRRRRLFSLAVVSRPGKKQHPLWLNEKRTTVVYKVSIQQTKYTTKEVVQ